MKSFEAKDVSNPYLFKILAGSIGPRPIAFVSTIDKDGNVNLSPFSFFNAFGVNPTTLIFSPSRRGRDNTTKHTYQNVKEVPEVVINVVTFDMVEQMSLSSTEYAKGVDEFVKAGFTKIESDTIRPPRVAESPVQYECKVRDVIETNDQGGAANLVICEVLKVHINEEVMDEDGGINQQKIDLVGRMGGNYYVRANGDALFELAKPSTNIGIGIDNLPKHIRNSKVLSGNDLARLGGVDKLPDEKELIIYKSNTEYSNLFNKVSVDKTHQIAKELISKGKIINALKLLMLVEV